MLLKKIIIVVILVSISSRTYPAIYEIPGHTGEIYDRDVAVLKKILSENENDQKALERMARLLFVMEKFDEVEFYSKKYLNKYKNAEIRYIRAISLANLSRQTEAIREIDLLLKDPSLTQHDRELLINKRSVFAINHASGGEPLDARPAGWGANALIVGVYDRKYSLIALDTGKKSLYLYDLKSQSRKIDIPSFLTNGLDSRSVVNITITADEREIFASIAAQDGGIEIMHRQFDMDDEVWLPWDTPSFANEGSINAYANLLADGEHLIFISNRDQSSGLDLYVTKRDRNGGWGIPKKVLNVNTPLDESSLSVHPDGETVYFSSNGRGGSGGYDIFKGRLSSNRGVFRVDHIINLTRINTYRNEAMPLYVPIRSDSAYYNYSKNYNRRIYEMDIAKYEPWRPEPSAYLDIFVYDAETRAPIRLTAKMLRLNDRTSGISLANPTDKYGRAIFAVRRKAKYTISISAEGYAYYTEKIDIGDKEDFIKKIIYLTKGKVQKGFVFEADNVYFDEALWVIRDESHPALERLHDFMIKNPGVKILITGHTDNTGGYDYNMALSRKRAHEIEAYLISRGIEKSRMTTRGYGYERNIKPNNTEEGRQMNRRVEITVMESE